MKVTILQPTRCDGKRYQPGSTVEVDRAAAKALIDAGAAEPFDAKAAAKAAAEAKAEAEAEVAPSLAAVAAASLLTAAGGDKPVET